MVKEGYLVDLMLVDLNEPNAVPYHDFASNVVYAMRSGSVDMVICR